MRRGQSNREIAISLGISEHTAKNHSRAILRKLRVADRAEAVAAAFERGLLHAGG
jgi:DNA-binding NarL/FixJ family response regulator